MGPKILIVDDDASVLFLHNLMVRESGMSESINAFNNVDDALIFLSDSLVSKREHLVFLDINMPVKNGWDFLDALEGIDPGKNVFVVMVTSSVNHSDREKANTYGHVIDFLEKPLNLKSCTYIIQHKELGNLFTGRDK